jgi:hypothetical protein
VRVLVMPQAIWLTNVTDECVACPGGRSPLRPGRVPLGERSHTQAKRAMAVDDSENMGKKSVVLRLRTGLGYPPVLCSQGIKLERDLVGIKRDVILDFDQRRVWVFICPDRVLIGLIEGNKAEKTCAAFVRAIG